MFKFRYVIGILLFFFFNSCKNDLATYGNEEKEISFNIPENFVLEELYQPSINEQGSWVAMAKGPNNVIFACDQYGKIYYFDAPAIDETLKPEDVKTLDLEIGEAHGLLWAFNSLYVAVNKRWDDDVRHLCDDRHFDVVIDFQNIFRAVFVDT